MTSEILAVERRTFDRERTTLLTRSEGKFVLIKGREVLGIFDTAEAAYEFGLSKLGNVPMLIAQVLREDAVAKFPALHLGLIHAHLQV